MGEEKEDEILVLIQKENIIRQQDIFDRISVTEL